MLNKLGKVGLLFMMAISLVSAPVKAENTEPIYVWGTVGEIREDQIEIENETDNTNHVIVNIHENTIILDAVTGKQIDLDEVGPNSSVIAYISPMMTRSLPPISNAFVVVANIPADFIAPQYYDIKEIVEKDEDRILLLNTKNDLLVTINEDTKLVDVNGKELQYADLTASDRLMVYAEIVLLSMPGQTTPSKVVVLPSEKNGWVMEEDAWFYYSHNNKLKNQWVASIGCWYYVGDDGAMVTNTVIDGCEINELGQYKTITR